MMGSMLAGTLTLLSWLAFDLGDAVHEVFPALVVSMLTYVVLSCVRNSIPQPVNR